MRWNEVTGAIARHKRASTQCGRLNTFASVSPWTCSGISRRPIAHRPRRPCIRPVLGRKNSKNDATVSKNSGFNLEHVFSIDPENLKAYYYLLQIAHMIQQLVEAGSLLRNLAAEFGRTPMQLFGSLKNLARRLLDAFRYMVLNDQAFDPLRAASIQIRLDSS